MREIAEKQWASMLRERPDTGAPLAMSAAPIAALAPALYQCVRVVAQLRAPEAAPSAIVWAERSVVLERVGVVGYLVVALVALTAPLLMRRPELARRAFEVCALVGALAGLIGGSLH